MQVTNAKTNEAVGQIETFDKENNVVTFKDNVSINSNTELIMHEIHHQTKLESILRSPFQTIGNLWNKEAEV